MAHVQRRALADDTYPVKELLYRSEYRFESDGSYSKKVTRHFQILSDEGVRTWSEVSAHFAPWHMTPPEIFAKVTNGKHVSILDPKTVAEETRDADDAAIYGDVRVVRAPLPQLKIGSRVEEIYTNGKISPILGKGTLIHEIPHGGVPRERFELVIDLPQEGLAFDHRILGIAIKPHEELVQGRRRLTFVASDLSPLEPSEPNLPYDRTAWPTIAFSAGTSWNQLARHYADILGQTAQATDLRQVARSLVKPGDSPLKKAQALLDWLHENVRYTGIEFGALAIIPHAPAEVLKRGYGDCKDQALLLVTMLGHVGISAHVALLRAGHDEDIHPELAGPNRFNHAIVYVPGKQPLWLDPTATYSRAGDLPLADQGRLALVIERNTEQLTTTPVAPAKANQISETRRIEWTATGTARVVEVTEASGSLESQLRDAFDLSAKDLRESLAKYSEGVYGSKSVVSHEITPSKNFDRAYRFAVTIDDATIADVDMSRATLTLNTVNLLNGLPQSLVQGEKRKDNYYLPNAHHYTLSYVVAPPSGFRLEKVPEFSRRDLGPIDLQRTAKIDAHGVLTVKYELKVDKNRWHPDEVMAARKGLQALDDEEPTELDFVHVGREKVDAGRVGEGLQIMRDSIKRQPSDAMAHARYAATLHDLGFAADARLFIDRANQLQPSSAVVQRTAGIIYTSDDLGVSESAKNRDRAAAFYRKSLALVPNDPWTTFQLLSLYLYNDEGHHFGKGAPFEEALRLFDTLDATQWAESVDGDYINSGLDILIALGREKEAIARVQAAPENTYKPFIRLVTAQLSGEANAVALAAERMGMSREERNENLTEAARFFIGLQRYKESSALLRQITSPSTEEGTATKLMPMIDALPVDAAKIAIKQPADVVRKAFFLTSWGVADSDPRILELFANLGHDGLTNTVTLQPMRRFSSATFDFENRHRLADAIANNIKFESAGDDKSGYIVTIKTKPGFHEEPLKVAVVRDQGTYKILGYLDSPTRLLVHSLELLEANKPAIAEQWLNQALRTDVGSNLAARGRFSLRYLFYSQANVPLAVKIASAICSLQEPLLAPRAAQIIDQSSFSPTQPELKATIEVSRSYCDAHEPAKALARLQATFTPFASDPYMQRVLANLMFQVGQRDEARAYLASVNVDASEREKNDVMIFNWLAEQGKFKQAREFGERLLARAKHKALICNDLAWLSLFLGKPRSEDLGYALEAVAHNKNRNARHTLAAIYLETGKIEDARRIWQQFVQERNGGTPLDDGDWYIFGRLAQEYGLLDTARRAFLRVKAPENPSPTATYHLAQRYLSRLPKSQD